LNELAEYIDKRMTVKEVAEALGVSEDSVLRSARRQFSEAIQNGKTTYLGEAQVTAIKQDLQTHHNLRSTAELSAATTDLEMIEQGAKFAAWALAKLKEQESALAEAKPKVEFFDQVASSKDAIPMREVAAVLNLKGWGRNKIFALLRAEGVLDDSNIPYREYQDRGYFRVVERSWSDDKGETHVTYTTLVYQRGLDYIRKVIRSNKARSE